ncbi:MULTISPECIES: DUF5798 family protein [unclassified Halorhabdus]|uniref:DUF5798 family protein n=1 Tax=unclassified Halorhabdus TaxID=2621901 RepID=UPI0023DB9A5C|nr:MULTISPECIES: DUF5798 family protein [unclassified Halorhabdus]WEL17609.1 Uncharacterized protein SVXHr_1440 [Halorhabdus sp. SVX81]WEL21490.1 Uncharacterized protein HBNXHr_1427 [Halorhabdus sp. BNX81]
MGFGDTAKKLQKVTSAAEDLYEKMNQLRGQVQSLREEVATTSEQVDEIETDLAEQRALIEAIAESQGLDVETVIADADIDAVEEGAEVTDKAGDTDGNRSEAADVDAETSDA